MRGVACGVDDALKVPDLNHEIPECDIWTGAHRRFQTTACGPAGSSTSHGRDVDA